MMNSRGLALLVLTGPGIASGQFVWPKPESHVHDPGAYREDPFITKYRTKFFAVFHGDFKTFEDAYKEIQGLVAKNPRDARALVWLGNGQTVEAGLLLAQGKAKQGAELLDESRKTMRRAVAMHPDDYGIYMMEAATLYVQGQYWPSKYIPASNWETMRDDCEHLLRTMGPKIKQVSVHVRGEAYGELGIACAKLGEKEKARKAFEMLETSDPGTLYAERAKSEIAKLAGS
jgi:tetratricopeptide (TPR) repeat protein